MSKVFILTWLYIKQHNQTGLKYFGKTAHEDPYKYYGSGKYWVRHLSVHGKDVTTIWCKLFETKQELVDYAISFSRENDIVNSTEWANLREKNGVDGSPSGVTATAKTKQKIKEARSGQIFTDATRQKMSLSHCGPKNHMYGKTHSLDAITKMKGRSYERQRRMHWYNNAEQNFFLHEDDPMTATLTRGRLTVRARQSA